MKFLNRNGKAIVNIETNGFLYCYKNKEYLAADWPDCAGSMGRILSLYKEHHFAVALDREINEALVFDTEITKKTVKDLLQIFPCGDYEVSEIEVNFLHQLNLTEFKETDQSTLSSYYPYMGCTKNDDLVLTQSKRFLDQDRIEYYEKLIKGRIFPRVVILEKSFKEKKVGYEVLHRSPRFIVDGHHKLKAYENLQIPAHAILFSLNEKPDIAKQKIEESQALLLDVWHFLDEEIIYFHIKYNPQCFTEKTNQAKLYNHLMDNYLKRTNNLRYGNWVKLIHENYNTKNHLKKQWVLNKLKVIHESVMTGSVKETYMWGDTESMQTGKCFSITNSNDFDIWTEKALGTPFSRIKLN